MLLDGLELPFDKDYVVETASWFWFCPSCFDPGDLSSLLCRAWNSKWTFLAKFLLGPKLRLFLLLLGG